MLGSKIFYIDAAAKKVCEAVVCGVSVNEQGFKVLSIKTSDGRYLVQYDALCFENEADAAAKLQGVIAANEQIKAIQDEANHKIDLLLEQIRGKPEFIYLTIKGEKTE